MEEENNLSGIDDSYYDISSIKENTNWNDVYIQRGAYNHLSLISQYKYDCDRIHLYDNNYYISKSAGSGVDIYIIDRGINTMHLDFTHVDKDNPLEKNGRMPTHGTRVASVAAGYYFGVAKNANIHMIATDMSIGSLLLALKYIKEIRGIEPHKTIINMSFGTYDVDNYSILKDVIDDLVASGFMFIASAGNNKVDSCTIRSIGDEEIFQEDYLSAKSSHIYSVATFSNYGSCTDIFAPGYVYAAYFPEEYIKNYDDSKISNGYMYAYGTSYSAPIVAGIAATLISENEDKKKFNQYELKKELIELSQKDIIGDNFGLNKDRLKDTPNRFVNNGK
ncbi:hypothetical protein PIROE2DRAFT_48035, partial [Piromyces sp. E2]